MNSSRSTVLLPYFVLHRRHDARPGDVLLDGLPLGGREAGGQRFVA